MFALFLRSIRTALGDKDRNLLKLQNYFLYLEHKNEKSLFEWGIYLVKMCQLSLAAFVHQGKGHATNLLLSV
ncbi:hypothetical protein FYF81_01420 [Vibrio vulnificus]|nr:hypothetical protein [Vibrio vulnificus]RZQ14545.1 hypothetical protein D8T46_11890 [Vibrio vulnificus]HAS8497950.1 hypothetical protein [Vibrio vulnificus]